MGKGAATGPTRLSEWFGPLRRGEYFSHNRLCCNKRYIMGYFSLFLTFLSNRPAMCGMTVGLILLPTTLSLIVSTPFFAVRHAWATIFLYLYLLPASLALLSAAACTEPGILPRKKWFFREKTALR